MKWKQCVSPLYHKYITYESYALTTGMLYYNCLTIVIAREYSGALLNDFNWFQKIHRYGKTSLSETRFPIEMH